MDSASCVYCVASANLPTVTAGAGQDNVAQTGVIVDRKAYNWPQKVTVVFSFIASVAVNKTLSLKWVVLSHGQAANMSDTAAYASPADAVVVNGATTAGPGTEKYEIDLKGAGRYLQLAYTPDASNTGTDTYAIAVMYAFDQPYTSS